MAREVARIFIVDDHLLVSAATAREIASLLPGADVCCVESAVAAEAAIAERGLAPEYILLDLWLPHADGLSGLVRLRHVAPQSIVAIFSGELSPQVMRDAFAQGARGYLTKTRDVDPFTDGMKRLFELGFFFPPEAAEPASKYQRAAHLTEREVAALNAPASGKVNKQRADILGVAESTFKTHLRANYKKLGVRTRIEAVSRARQLGLIGTRRRA